MVFSKPKLRRSAIYISPRWGSIESTSHGDHVHSVSSVIDPTLRPLCFVFLPSETRSAQPAQDRARDRGVPCALPLPRLCTARDPLAFAPAEILCNATPCRP